MDYDVDKFLEAMAAEKETKSKEALGNHLTGDRRPDAAFRQQYGPNWRTASKSEEKEKTESFNLSELSDEELVEMLGIDEG